MFWVISLVHFSKYAFFYTNGVLLGSLPKLQALLGVYLKVDVSGLFEA